MNDKTCEYKDMVCDQVDACPYQGKCLLYDVSARGDGFITDSVCKGEIDLLATIRRYFGEGKTEVKITNRRRRL